ncbi:MAG: 30S ribosomal protein S1 [Kiritimatiellia bacterium]
MAKQKTVTKKPAEVAGDERATLSAMYDETMKNFVEGSIVRGKILEVRPNEVLVDIGYKSEGIIPAAEFKKSDDIKAGDELDVLLEGIENEEGMVILSREKAVQKLRWDNVLQTCKEGGTIMGAVVSRVKGGLIVDVDGVDAFLPGSQADLTPVHDLDIYLGQKLEFKILKINSDRRNIVLSRRELLEERRNEKKRELLSEIMVGQLRHGVVKNITEFGAFVDLDGLDGLLHITDMSWGRINNPREMVSVGQEIEVVILDINHEKGHVSLGLKQKTQNPWTEIEKKFPVGSRLRGKVVNVAPYGAFVELEPGVEGLVHVSEMSWTKRVTRASDLLANGQEVDVVVLSVNSDDKKIALGIRQTEENPWDGVRERYPIGSRVHGKIRNFTSYGAFVELTDGIDGMIHVSDMSWTRKINHPSEIFKKGDEVDAVVLEVNPDQQRISLGFKQAAEDPWSSISTRYKVGQKIKGVVTKLASFGAFVQIEEGIDGLVHISQISDQRVEKVKDVLRAGQEVEARIVRIDAVDRKIGLSIKAAVLADEDFKVSEDMLQGLKAAEDLGGLAGAFDEAFNLGDEWKPGKKGE